MSTCSQCLLECNCAVSSGEPTSLKETLTANVASALNASPRTSASRASARGTTPRSPRTATAMTALAVANEASPRRHSTMRRSSFHAGLNNQSSVSTGATTVTSASSSSTASTAVSLPTSPLSASSSTLATSPRRTNDVLLAKMERLEMKVEEKLDALRASDETDRSKLPAGERPAWWVDKEEAAKRTSSPKSPLQKAVSRAMRDVVMVRAIDDCITKQPGMLSFLSGEVFAVLAKPSKTYWKGQHKGKIGRFPAAKVEPIADADPAALYSAGVSPSAEALAQLSPRSRLEAKTLQFFRVRAIADYQPAAGGAHLRFSEGESFCVLSRETPDWWKGQHKGRIGRFPRDHVVEIDEAGDEIAPRPRVGEVPLTGSPSHRGGKLFDDDTSVSSLHEEDSTTSTTTSHTTTTTDSSKLNDSGKKRKKKKRETIAFIASGASSSTAIDSSGAPLTPKSGGATSPPVSARASAASPRATAASPRATAASPQADAPSPAAVASTRSGSSKRASSPVGSMMYRRALAGVEEAQRKLTTAVGEEEAANDTLRGLHAVVVSNDASCLAFQRQIESLEQEIKSKKVSKRERERMNGVLDGIKVEYDEQRGKQSTLQRQVDEATARADAARFAGVEARRLFETRSLELQRIIDREGRRGGLAQSAPVDAPQVPTAADVAADASASYSAAVRQALNRTSPTRARASSKGDVRADLPPPASAADTKAVADAPVRVGSWVRAKIPLEPSAAVLAASGLVAASVAADGPPPLPPMENVVQDSPNGTLLRPPRLLDDDDNDDDDDDTTEEQQ